MNRKDFMKGLLAVACGASVVSAIGAQYNAEQPQPTYTPEDTNATVMTSNATEMAAADVERVGKEELQVRKAYAERYKMMYANAVTTHGDNSSYVCSGRFVQLMNDPSTWIWEDNRTLNFHRVHQDGDAVIMSGSSTSG